MENKKLGQEPAFAQTMLTSQELDQLKEGLLQFGMSKRFYAACAAMQGFISSGYEGSADVIAEMAYLFADELLKQENE